MKKSAYSIAAIIVLSSTALAAPQRESVARVYIDQQGSAPAGYLDGAVLKTAPSVKIGVRVCAVPEALAAHIGRGGLMISNIVVGGPADLAGIDRYDIIASFAGKPIDTMEDLLSAIAQTGANNTVDVSVIRQAQETVVQLTPIQADQFSSAELKYEEALVEQVPSSIKFFGHRMQADPQGGMMVEPLGELYSLPRDIKLFLNRDLDINAMLQDDAPFNIIDLNVDLDDLGWHAIQS